MVLNSLALRLFLSASVWIIFTLFSGGLLLSNVFRESSQKAFEDKLNFFKDSKQTDLLYLKANKNEKIFFVPALTGLGAPYWNPNVRGTFFGLSRNTSKNDIIKSTLDSLCYQTYELIECMEKDSKIKISEIKVDGGMINNKNFLTSLANITQTKILKPKNIYIACDGPNKNTDIYLVDSYGEATKFYQLSKVTFVGGSIVKHGGQNPLEPARFGNHIINGKNNLQHSR